MAMAAAEDYGISPPLQLHMVSAFLAMEPPDGVISLAREFGGGSLDDRVQSCIWRQCICKADVKLQGPYLKRFLKKLILEIESDGVDVLDELYEHYAFYLTSLKDNDVAKGNSRILKCISFLFSNESSGLVSCPESRNLEVQLQCSLNMLEGDTGCSLWPSSIFLSEFILSFPEIFANKCCFEVGSGVGLVGICIAHVKASKVILSDGDLSALANMKVNLELNHLTTNTCTIDDCGVDHIMVQCIFLPWESASKDDLCSFAPDIMRNITVRKERLWKQAAHFKTTLKSNLNWEGKMSEQGGEKSRGISVPPGQLPPPPPANYYYGTFQGVANYPPPSSQPFVGFPQPMPPPGCSGYAVVTGRPFREERLPCCGIGVGWFLFISGFFLGAIPWYIGAFLLICIRLDYREKAGLVACTLAAILASIALTLGVTRASHAW